jgi:hypothetical protein
MAIERVRICGACERECPGWAARCPACGSLSLQHRITFVSSAPLRGASLGSRPGAELAANKPTRKSAARSRPVAARDAKVRKPPLTGEPETRAV